MRLRKVFSIVSGVALLLGLASCGTSVAPLNTNYNNVEAKGTQVVTSTTTTTTTVSNNDDKIEVLNIVEDEVDLSAYRATSYNTNLSSASCVSNILTDYNNWYVQYPSGTDEGGMLLNSNLDSYKSKYASYCKNYNGESGLKVSLDSAEEGTSSSKSGPRIELTQNKTSRWALNDHTSFEYSFYYTSTNISTTCFTIGQIFQADNNFPLCRIEFNNGNLTAWLKSYYITTEDILGADGNIIPKGSKTNADRPMVNIDLGDIEEFKYTDIKLEINNKHLNIWRDSELCCDYTFAAQVDGEAGCVYKTGVYASKETATDRRFFAEAFFNKIQYVRY